MKALRWTIGFLLAVLIVAFAVTNRQTVSVYWSPFHNTLEWPLYLVVLVLMATGFLTGGLIVWLNTMPVRRNARQLKKQVHALEKELESAKAPPAQDAPRPYISPEPVNQNATHQPQPAAIDYYKS